MLFISHIYTAIQFEKNLAIKKSNTYYFASILPDIRYTTDLKRETTHVHLHQLSKYFNLNSDLYKGYYLHLLIDDYMAEWQFHEKLRSKYPTFLQKFFKPILLNIILELYALEKLNTLQPITLDNTFHPEYKKFGMKEADVKNYASYIQAMINDFSIETATRVILSDPKLRDNKKINTYKKLAFLILNITPIKWYLLNKVDNIYTAFLRDLTQRISNTR